MKKRYILFIAFFILVLFAVVSNPTKDEYVSFVKDEISEGGHPIIGMFSGPLVNTFTSKKNFGIFTLYETRFEDKSGEYAQAIGFLNNFYWVHSPVETTSK
jgi:hypothetical protein